VSLRVSAINTENRTDRVEADKRPSPLDRLVEEDLSKFLRENIDKIKLKRYVPPKGR